MLLGKKSSDEDTRKIEDCCNYWADKKGVDYSTAFTAQDVLSSTETANTSNKKTKKNKKNTSGGSCSGGCGGGCFGGGCGGGCF